MAKRRSKGEGTIFQRKDGLWRAAIVLPDGQRRVKTSKSQKVVRDWLQAQRQSVHDQVWTSNDRLTVGEFLAHYLTDIAAATVRPRTLEGYAWLIKKHIEPVLGDIRLTGLTPQRVQAFYTDRLQKGLSPNTVLHIHNILHRTLEQAVRWSLVPRNVTDLVDAPKPRQFERTTWSAEEARRYLEVARTHRLYALYVLALYTGMRQGELLGLQYEDIDWGTK